MSQMKNKKRQQLYSILYIAIHEPTNTPHIYKEITPLAELIGVNRATIYRKFEKEGDLWVKKDYKVMKCFNINLKSRRGI